MTGVAHQPHAALSPSVQALMSAVEQLRSVSAVELPGPQALTECAVLMSELDRLKAVVLARVADVDTRGLHDLDDAPTAASWVDRQESGLHRAEISLARRLQRYPHLAERVGDGLGLDAAARIAAALTTVRPHLDRADGLIDGQPGEQVLSAVIVDGVSGLICQAKGGLEDSPYLRGILTGLQQIADSRASQLARLEQALLVLPIHLQPAQLPSALAMLVDALLPQRLQDHADLAHRERGLQLTRNHGDSGWHLRGDLDDECGELLHTVLTAARATDPDNPTDTAAWALARATGAAVDEIAHTCGDTAGPRSRRQIDHDALAGALRTLLDSAALGVRGKSAPHIGVTVGLDTLHGAPGALPALGDSGHPLPLRLVRSWIGDSYLTRYVMSRGRKVIETSHTDRTLKAHERRMKHVETGGRCQGGGCTRGPGHQLIPHHVTPWVDCGTTSLADTVWLCAQTHHDLHSGNRTITLNDGRRLNAHGWVS